MMQTKSIPNPIIVVVTSITLVNDTLRTVDITVPAGHRWKLLFMKMQNPDDVVRSVKVELFLEAAKTNYLARLGYYSNLEASSAERFMIPNSKTSTDDLITRVLGQPAYPLILDAGWTLEVQWLAGGASTGGTDADGLVYVYERVF